MKSYTVVQGSNFLIEWFVDYRGYSQPFEYFEELTQKQQDKIMALFSLMANRGKILDKKKFVNEDDGIYAFKMDQERFLSFFFKDRKIIITNAFRKKTQKMPPNEKTKALKVYRDYIKRVQEGTYYEKEN